MSGNGANAEAMLLRVPYITQAALSRGDIYV